MTLHGSRVRREFPFRVAIKDDEIAVNGSIVVKQSDFGIATVLGPDGAIRVQDEVNLRFQIRARPCLTQPCR